MAADLDFLATEFPSREGSLTPETRAAFTAALETVRPRLAGLDRAEFLMEVQRLVAIAGNAHTESLLHERVDLRLPLVLRWYPDGLFVVAAPPEHADLLGARIEAVAGHAPEAVLAGLEESFAGRPQHVRRIAGGLTAMPEVLAGLGLLNDLEAVPLTLTDRAGARREVLLRPVQKDMRKTERFASAFAADRDQPHALRKVDEAAYLAWPGDGRIAYLRINRNDDRDLPDRLEELLDEIADRSPSDIVVDLRHNGGGNYLLTAPFAHALPALLPADGRLVVVTGRNTFSAGLITAAILKASAGNRAIVAGEPAGDNLRFWSEGGLIELPRSGLRIHVSDGFHDWARGYDAADPRYRLNPRNAEHNRTNSAAAGDLEPDWPGAVRFDDMVAGRDPVLDMVFERLARDGAAGD